MGGKDITDEELEKELDKAFRANEARKDHCGTAIPENREIGVQRNKVKLKKE